MASGQTTHGKWAQPGVPHQGWTCVDVEDLGQPTQTCEMCEVIEIRYVHYMRHPHYTETLGVGCVCAEHMEQDYVGPRLREKQLRSKTQRRKSWVKRQWNVSSGGNPYVNTEGFNLAVFKASSSGSWRLKVTCRATGQTQFGRRDYPSEQAAKLAALDALFWAKDHLGN